MGLAATGREMRYGLSVSPPLRNASGLRRMLTAPFECTTTAPVGMLLFTVPHVPKRIITCDMRIKIDV